MPARIVFDEHHWVDVQEDWDEIENRIGRVHGPSRSLISLTLESGETVQINLAQIRVIEQKP